MGFRFFFFHCLSDDFILNCRTLYAIHRLSLKPIISLLLKSTVNLLFFSEHKLYGFPQSVPNRKNKTKEDEIKLVNTIDNLFCLFFINPVDTGRKLIVHKTFNLCSVSTRRQA